MANGKKLKRSGGQAKKRKRTNPRKVPSLLILECDSAKLASQSLSIATHVRSQVSSLAPQAYVKTVLGDTWEDLSLKLAACAEGGATFDNIVVIAHSNSKGICL